MIDTFERHLEWEMTIQKKNNGYKISKYYYTHTLLKQLILETP